MYPKESTHLKNPSTLSSKVSLEQTVDTGNKMNMWMKNTKIKSNNNMVNLKNNSI